MAAAPQPGDKAPDFRLPSDEGGDIRLSDLAGRTVVLYFYPKDDTTGCTNEAKAFTSAAKDFASAGATIVGVSKDTVKSHGKFRQKYGLSVRLGADVEGETVERYGVWIEKSKARFATKHGLTFPLLADAEHEVAEKYGVWQEKSRYGRKYMGIVRTTYLIGADGKVLQRWDNVKVDGHAQAVADAIKS